MEEKGLTEKQAKIIFYVAGTIIILIQAWVIYMTKVYGSDFIVQWYGH